ncbi:MAG: sensor histidine kinase [Candidatus Eremiobacterota bacterium]
MSWLGNLQARWRQERAGQGFLNPVVFSVGARWITWIIALAIVFSEAAPAVNLRHAGLLLALTGLQLTVMSLYLPVVRPRLGGARWLEGNTVLPALDITAAAAVIWASGGWRSPFYEFSLTSVLAPSLRYGLRGATLSSVYFSAVFVAAVAFSGPGMDSVYNADGRLDGGFVGALLNPFMVSYFSAFLAELLRRLEEEKSKVRELAAREERLRLGREIHDGVAQTMFMLTLSLDACRELALRRGHQELGGKLEELVPVARQALWEVRNAMHDKSALLAGEVPLSEAVRSLVREFTAVSGVPVDLQVVGDEPALPLDHRVCLYRTIQEAMANAFKHSRASQVALSLRFGQEDTEVLVEDQGTGFDRASVQAGHGLGNMQARVEEAGGTFDLDSAPGRGTRVRVVLPGRSSMCSS